MKKLLLITTIILLNIIILSAQDLVQQVQNLAENHDYDKAVALIPNAIKQAPKDLNFTILCGDIYFEVDNYNSAYDMYKKADEMKSGQSKIMRKEAKALSFLNRHKEAIELLRKAIKEDKDDVYNYLELGQAYIKADSLSQAELVTTQAKKMNSKIPDAYITLGDLYFAQKVYELAKDNYEQALSINEKFLDARVKLATAYYWLANREVDSNLANELFSHSLKEWDNVTKQDTKNAKAFFEKGKILFFSHQFRDAAVALTQFVTLRPSGSLGRWYLAQSLYAVGNCDSAEPHLEIVAKEIDSVKNKANLDLARCYFDKKKYKESLDKYNSVRASTKLSTDDLGCIAQSAYNIGDTLEAIKNWENIIDQDPSNSCKLILGVGRILIFRKDYPHAIEVLSKSLKVCDDTIKSKANFFIGLCYFYQKKADISINYLKASCFFDKQNLTSQIYLADAFASLADTLAKQDIKDSAKLYLDSAKFYFNYVIESGKKDSTYKREMIQSYGKLCGIVLDSKNYAELKKVASAWVEADPESEYSNLYLAVAYQGSQEAQGACKYYKKVIKINPKNSTASSNLKALSCP